MFRELWISILIILSVGVLQLAVASRGGKTETQPWAEISTRYPHPVVPFDTIRKFERKDGRRIDIVYPKFKSVPFDFNDDLHQFITDRIIKFRKDATEFDVARKITDGSKSDTGKLTGSQCNLPDRYTLLIDTELGEASDTLISFILDECYFAGGAHPNKTYYQYHYNPKTRTSYTSESLIPTSNDTLIRISAYLYQSILHSLIAGGNTFLPDTAWFNRGLSTKRDNFGTFLFESDSIVFIIPPYQIAPYAFGSFIVPVPKSFIDNHGALVKYLDDSSALVVTGTNTAVYYRIDSTKPGIFSPVEYCIPGRK